MQQGKDSRQQEQQGVLDVAREAGIGKVTVEYRSSIVRDPISY